MNAEMSLTLTAPAAREWYFSRRKKIVKRACGIYCTMGKTSIFRSVYARRLLAVVKDPLAVVEFLLEHLDEQDLAPYRAALEDDLAYLRRFRDEARAKL